MPQVFEQSMFLFFGREVGDSYTTAKNIGPYNRRLFLFQCFFWDGGMLPVVFCFSLEGAAEAAEAARMRARQQQDPAPTIPGIYINIIIFCTKI